MDLLKYKRIQQVQLIVLVLNMTTAVSKLFAGILINSVSMTADGVHSLGDGFNNIAGMIGVYFAFQPVDDKHPYGHRKFETLTTFLISGILLFTALSIIKGAFERIINPVIPSVTTYSFIVMIISIFINLFVAVYEKNKGTELKSEFLLSDSAHTLSDIFVSISVTGTLVAIRYGYPWIDIIVSVIISLIISKTALDIIRKGTDILCDAMVLDPQLISDTVREFNEIHSCHKIRSRGYPDDIHLDLHVVVNNDMTLEKAHTLIHRIDSLLRTRFPGVTDVNVHIDPMNYFKNKYKNTTCSM